MQATAAGEGTTCPRARACRPFTCCRFRSLPLPRSFGGCNWKNNIFPGHGVAQEPENRTQRTRNAAAAAGEITRVDTCRMLSPAGAPERWRQLLACCSRRCGAQCAAPTAREARAPARRQWNRPALCWRRSNQRQQTRPHAQSAGGCRDGHAVGCAIARRHYPQKWKEEQG